jgi:aminopeptidase N
MKRILLLVVLLISFTQIFAQFQEPEDTSWKHIYRETAAITNNLVHTKLEVKFDFDKSWMYGKEWLTLQPHFYATDSVRLDAKGMDIKEVALVTGAQKKPLQYKYDGHQLNIKLDKSYAGGEKYTLYFDYISKPNDYKTQGSMAITDAKGLYFINPKGEEKDKPTQIWTQGETEANSVWMVTIDKPNQKTTEEIYMTVPSRFTTLSNGLKISEKKNADGSRTDYWKMDLPHAPYLFFMGVGEYSVVKDKPYKGKEVSYYVEPSQAPYAKGVFGNTHEMIAFFSDKLGFDFPWPKYAQIVGRDYVSGAMENTTATLHQESAYQNNRQLLDGNHWEETIAHELFHQWFGDLVTTESWSNITVNESFANYSEYLWDEYKYGKDFADEHNFEDMSGYLMSGSNHKDLVRFYYSNKEDVFDAVSYNKGGRILHMLRNYVGDDAFFKSLNNYLTTNKFKTGEAQQLRLAFEEVTGRDLNWFFNQWYYGSGQPKLKIDYDYSTPGIAKVKISQIQKDNPAFILPIAIDVYNGPNKVRHNVWVRNLVDSFSFPYTVKPDLINVDGDKILLAEKIDNKSEDEFKAQWMYAKNYLDRKEALDFFAKKNMPEIAKGLYDKYSGLRTYSIQKISGTPYKSDKVVLEEMERIAKSDFSKKTRAAAIKFLSKNGDASNKAIFEQAVNDSSYSVAGAGLSALAALDPDHAYTLAKKLNVDSKGALREAINSLLYSQGKEEDFDLLSKSYNDMGFSFEKLGSTSKFAEYLSKLNNFNNIKKGIDDIITFYNAVPEAYKDRITPLFKSSFDRIIKSKGQEAEDYIKSVFK